ncbi:TPA: hypothetical protein ACHYVN_004049 [Enterobacter hormaechei]
MPVKEHDLHASGFTKKEVARIKRHLETGDSLDRVLFDLSGYFRMFIWVCIGMAVITILSVILGSPSQAISCAIAVVGVRLEKGNYPTIRASPNSQRRFLISVCSSMKGKG